MAIFLKLVIVSAQYTVYCCFVLLLQVSDNVEHICDQYMYIKL